MSSSSSGVATSIEAVAKVNQTLRNKLLPIMVRVNGTHSNMVASTISLCSLMVMLQAGAKGKTEKEVTETLDLPLKVSSLYEGFENIKEMYVSKPKAERGWLCGICFSNHGHRGSDGELRYDEASCAFVQKGYDLKPEFEELMKRFFVLPKKINYAQEQPYHREECRQLINKWVEKQTHEHLRHIIPEGVIQESTRMIVVHAIYFKTIWKCAFDKFQTEPVEFITLASAPVLAKMMKKCDVFAYERIKALGCTALQLPLAGSRLDMLVLLPDSPDGFSAMENAYFSFDFTELKLQDKNEVAVQIPKFKIVTKIDTLREMLQSIGIVRMFNHHADLSHMCKDKGFWVSVLMQKVFIEVSEEGTEPAAIRQEKSIRSMKSQVAMPFKCNRPFIFLIRDRYSGLILLSGRVVDPCEKDI